VLEPCSVRRRVSAVGGGDRRKRWIGLVDYEERRAERQRLEWKSGVILTISIYILIFGHMYSDFFHVDAFRIRVACVTCSQSVTFHHPASSGCEYLKSTSSASCLALPFPLPTYSSG
jgi:hypothetical protein